MKKLFLTTLLTALLIATAAGAKDRIASISLDTASIGGGPENQPISINLRGAKLGDALISLYRIRPFSYTLASQPLAPGGTTTTGAAMQMTTPDRDPAPGAQGQGQGQDNLYGIPVNFAYSGTSIDEAIKLLCRGADVNCDKLSDLWFITRNEVYIIDKDVFWTYAVSNGGGGGATTSSTASTPPTGTSGTSATASTSAPSAGATSAVGSSSGSDSVTMSGNFDDFVLFIKSFLGKNGTVQMSKSGYIVVMDTPSAIARVRKVMEKDLNQNDKVNVKVDVIQVTLTDTYSAGVNWNAVIKKVTINGAFAPAGAFNFGYNTTLAGNAITTLLGVLGEYGKTRVVQTWETTAKNGVPIFFNETDNIPVFTQTNAITTGVSQSSTSVSYVSVGLKVKILPNIRTDSLNGGIYAEVSQLTEMDSSGGSNPTTAPRTSLTNTAVPLDLHWGDSLVLTGFKNNTISTDDNGIPFLSRIPFFGALFGSQAKNNTGSELAIVITATRAAKERDRI